MLRRWNDLPDFMRTPEVLPYWEILYRKRGQLILKRIFDLVVALILLVILAIPMAVISVWIKLDSPGTVLYRQERVTTYGMHFVVYKFRSMKKAFDFAQYGIRINQIGTIVASIKHQLHGFFLSDRLIAAP